MTNAVAKTDRPKDIVAHTINKMTPQFQAALPSHISPEKFARTAISAVNANPDLREADPKSLFGAMLRCAQDGLIPDGREAALVIFNSKRGGDWVKSVQAMPMIGGLMKMMRQSGEVAWVDAQVVYSKDRFQYRPGLDDTPIFEPKWFADRGEPIGVYAVARLKGGEIVPPEIMSLDEIEKVRSVSRSANKGPWVDWWEQMALKTVLRRLLKRLPTSTDVVKVFEHDETMRARESFTVTQIDYDEDLPPAEDLPRPTGKLQQLERKVSEPGPEPEEADVALVDVEAWKDRIDRATTIAGLKKVEADFAKQHGEGEPGAAAVLSAFDDMRSALSRSR